MVTVTSFTARKNDAGEEFFTLTLQGDVELVKSKTTGRFYATSMQTTISSTLDEVTCKALVGKSLPGRISKIECEPYNYTIESTGEVIQLSHTYEYIEEEDKPQPEEVVEEVIH